MDPELARTDTVVARHVWGWVVDAYKRDAPRMRAVAAKTAEVYPRMGHLLRLVMAELARLYPSVSTQPESAPTTGPMAGVLTYSDLLEMIRRDPENPGRQIDLISSDDVVIDKDSYLKALRDTVAEIEAGNAKAKWWDIALLTRVARRKTIREARTLFAQIVMNPSIYGETRHQIAQTMAALCERPADLLALLDSKDEEVASGALQAAADSEVPEIKARVDAMLAQPVNTSYHRTRVDEVLSQIRSPRAREDRYLSGRKSEDEGIRYLLRSIRSVSELDGRGGGELPVRGDSIIARGTWSRLVECYKRDAPRMLALAAEVAGEDPALAKRVRFTMAELARLYPSVSTQPAGS